MGDPKDLLINKNILIYGLGKSGIAVFNFLKKENNLNIFDDNKNFFLKKKKNFCIKSNQILKKKFDYIFLSPGININKCSLSKYLLKNKSIIISELDIFQLSYPLNKKITITGTNGKSTTSKLVYELIRSKIKDVRLVGNIGNPILNEKNVKTDTMFVIEASSYQIDYSKYFYSNYSIILNLSPDHLERHGSFKNYIKAKFKLILNQKKNSYAFIENNNKALNTLINRNKINSKVIKVDYKKFLNLRKKITNNYFNNISNLKNLSFAISLCLIFKVNKNSLFKIINKFKGLKFRQQIIYKKKNITIINDSKSTSFSSTIPLLKSYKNIYWIVGGLPKKGDVFDLPPKYFKEVKAYLYGKNLNFFISKFKKKINYKKSIFLNQAINLLFKDIKKITDKKIIILFSPSAASFDQFKNFEERGNYFNKLIKSKL